MVAKYKSLFNVWEDSCRNYSNNIAFADNSYTEKITYREAFRILCFLAEKFQKLGAERFDRVSLFAVNSVYWLIIEQAFITIGATVISKSSQISENELEYVFNNSESDILVTDKEDIIKFLLKNNDKIKFIIYTGKDKISTNDKIFGLHDILSELNDNTQIKTDWIENPDDIAYINYTSGTSSMPKGAMLPNVGMSYVIEQLQKFSEVKEGRIFVGTFPLSSAGAKSVNLLCFSKGCTVMFTQYCDFYDLLERFSPDYFELAPKVIQTIYNKMMDSVHNKGCFFEILFKIAYNLENILLKFKRKQHFILRLLKPIDILLDKIFFKRIRNTLIKDEALLTIGSAHLAKPLEDFLNIININFLQHYGMTETTGLAISNTLISQFKHPYSVGIPFEGTTLTIINPETKEELKNGEVGLITLKGPGILKRYYGNEEATKKAFINGDFLNTGDLGYKDKDGYLYVISRYDDVIVLSNGYNVYTPIIENEAKDSIYISQIVIAGHGKPFLSALVVLNYNQYDNWCNINNVNNIEPNSNQKFKEFLIEHLNHNISRKENYKYYEKLKKVYFLNNELSEENGMLTGTLKIKYKKVINTYKKEIESMYRQ